MSFRIISIRFMLASTLAIMVAHSATSLGQERILSASRQGTSQATTTQGFEVSTQGPVVAMQGFSGWIGEKKNSQVGVLSASSISQDAAVVRDAIDSQDTELNPSPLQRDLTESGPAGSTAPNNGGDSEQSSGSSSSNSVMTPIEEDWIATNAAFSETDVSTQGQINFNDFPANFLSGLTLRNDRWAAKIGGYVKADLIHDFRAIESRDTFDPVTIPIGEPQWTSTRFHARQTRLNCDARWIADTGKPLRIMFEGDFFGYDNQLRLRHAYGEYENLIVGQTWTTFTHRAALPNTLDLVGDVASVGRRQTQVRYSKKFLNDHLIIAGAIEDARVTVEEPFLDLGVPRSPLPDAILRARLVGDRFQLQIAGLARRIGFQPTGREVIPFNGGGINTTGLLDFTQRDRLYGGVLWGNGIGSYRDLPDLAPSGPGEGIALETYAWYVGLTHQWNERWSSNVTYSKGDVNTTTLQPADSIQRTQYLATNLIWQPTASLFIGGELLWGMRMNRDLAEQDASRLMLSFGFLLP
ncbi:MAG: hypothetical protein RLY14_689 [Planctomycetota bacterium]